MTPFFEVSHLASSASFYSAVFQPLGLFFISASDHSPPTITYGTSSRTRAIFQIREAATPKVSHATLSASSSQAVADFQAFAIRANPASSNQSHQSPGAVAALDSSDFNRTRIRDLDGNIMDVVHLPSSHQSVRYGDAASNAGIGKTESHQDGSSRILDWTYDVALSDHNHGPAPSATGGPTSTWAKQPDPAPDKQYTVLRRSVTTSILEEPRRENGESGLGSTAVVGALLGAAAGAAAGAALTYSLMKAERERGPRQEHEIASVQRRATFPHAMTAAGDGRYVEVERSVERFRYPEAPTHFTDPQQPPLQLDQYNQAHALTSGAANDYYEDPQSRHLWPMETAGNGSVYGHMDAQQPSGAPLMLMDAEQHSAVGSSRHSTMRPPSVRGGTIYEADQESFVSAQSKRSSSTIRGPPPPTVETELSIRSRAPSKAPSMAPSRVSSMAPSRAPSMAPSRAPSMAPSKAPSMAPSRAPSMAPSRVPSMAPSKAPSKAPSRIGGGSDAMMSTGYSVFHSIPPSASRAPTQVSARNIGLPTSAIGSSDAGWEDVISLAPSDSISCIGSRTSRRA
ncbi:hypothetical protein ACRALDRAFT_2142113 [Sodiomyces alcalophilus JCM 7366]|uniref:uncharacterized protein n=1 Tax=Sodiomyces alcalophilus JCM 7366 TaxID=591952 RepID=UPI0039B69CF4